MSFRLALVILNVIAIGAILGVIFWRVVSIRRNPEKEPANLTPFLQDDDLEGRRLERVLGWALVMGLITAIAIPAYFIWEPTREQKMVDLFKERSIQRGATLFANKQMDAYDAEFSLLCADCHGSDAKGSVAPFVIQPEADKCQQKANQKNPDVPECLPDQVQWSAPDLTTAGLRFSKAQLIEIVTYGRPGTPMPAWGVKSGKGAKNDQSIEDLVNYILSLQITPAQAQAQSAKAIGKYKQQARGFVTDRQDNLSTAESALADAQSKGASADELATLQTAVTKAQSEVQQAIAYRDEVNGLSDGAILFRLNCARCHTKGWSYFQNEPYRTDLPVQPQQGSGALGPSLLNGAVELQFPGQAGVKQQYTWIADGTTPPDHQQYGARGISTGRMPHFGQMLTKAQINAIIEYERSL